MSISFFITAIITKPNLKYLIEGMFIPSFDDNSILIVLGLIGTTVVPYNIFLHSSLVTEKWDSIKKLKTARIESFLSIFLGGIVSLSIIVTAASVNTQDVKSVIDLSRGAGAIIWKICNLFSWNWFICIRYNIFNYSTSSSSICSKKLFWLERFNENSQI